MKKFGFMVLVVMAFVMGICGRNIVDDLNKQKAERFVSVKTYQDELYPGREHKAITNSSNNAIFIDADRGIYADASIKNGKLVYTVYNGFIEKDVIEFERMYRAADDQTKVVIVRNGDVDNARCVTFKGDLFRNVVMTELGNL